MNPKQKVILYLSIFFIAAAALVGYAFYADTTETVEFDDFSVEVPVNSEFEDVSSNYDTGMHNFVKSYRCTDKDLTISSFDKNYVEDTFKANTGNEIDYGKSVLEQLSQMKNMKVKNTSENITIYIANTRVNGAIDTDVAGVYNDNDHFIIVEGGDVELIENVTNSIKILS